MKGSNVLFYYVNTVNNIELLITRIYRVSTCVKLDYFES